MTLVDTNVILDITTRDPAWYDWSLTQIERAAARGPLIINDVIYAELSVRYESIELLDETIEAASLRHDTIPRQALFLAGKAFRHYRARGGGKGTILPDFFVGAHAAIRDHTLLTRDVARIRTYFPTVRLLAPYTGSN